MREHEKLFLMTGLTMCENLSKDNNEFQNFLLSIYDRIENFMNDKSMEDLKKEKNEMILEVEIKENGKMVE